MSSFSEVFSNKASGPYTKPVKCKVVAVAEPVAYSKDGEERQALTVAISDGTTVIKAIAYDRNKFKYLKVDQTVVIRETIRRQEDGQPTMVLTKTSKVFLSGPMEVPTDHTSIGRNIVNPPPADKVTVKEALSSPVKKKVSVVGKVTKDEEVRSVMVKGEQVKIRTICVRDESDEAKITLWRDLAECDCRPGSYIKVTDVVTNLYNGKTTLQTTGRTTVTKIEAPEQDMTITVVGVMVENNIAELLLQDDSVLTVSAELLQSSLSSEEEVIIDIESLTLSGPLKLKVTCRGGEINKVSKV